MKSTKRAVDIPINGQHKLSECKQHMKRRIKIQRDKLDKKRRGRSRKLNERPTIG